MKALISLFFIFNLQQTYAGFDRGNGGDAIICPLEDTAILYDYHETTEIRRWNIQLGEDNLVIMDKVEMALSRLDKNNPARANRLRKYAKNFFSETEFKTNVQLNDIPDTGDGWIPQYCDLKQVAIQRYKLLPGEKRYTINQDIWEKFDNTNKAMLILHEVIYRDFMEDNDAGSSTSRFARYLHGTLVSDNFDKISGSLREYHDFLRMLYFQNAESHAANGSRYQIRIQKHPHPMEYYDDNTVSFAPLYKHASIHLPGVKLKMQIDPRNGHYNRGLITFAPEGYISKLGIDLVSVRNKTFQVGKLSVISTKENHYDSISIKLLEDGSIKEILPFSKNGWLSSNVSLKARREGQNIICKARSSYGEKVSLKFFGNTFSESDSTGLKCTPVTKH